MFVSNQKRQKKTSRVKTYRYERSRGLKPTECNMGLKPNMFTWASSEAPRASRRLLSSRHSQLVCPSFFLSLSLFLFFCRLNGFIWRAGQAKSVRKQGERDRTTRSRRPQAETDPRPLWWGHAATLYTGGTLSQLSYWGATRLLFLIGAMIFITKAVGDQLTERPTDISQSPTAGSSKNTLGAGFDPALEARRGFLLLNPQTKENISCSAECGRQHSLSRRAS